MTVAFQVRGMSCAHCAGTITSAVTPLPGVVDVHVDIDNGVVTVTGTPDERAVTSSIEESGYHVDGPVPRP